MSYGIQDFSRGNYRYTADDGKNYAITERNVVALATSLSAADGTEVGGFKGKPRHMTFVSTTEVGTAPNSYYPKRKVVFNTANYATVKALTPTMDGVQFAHKGGHTGEKTRK